MKWWVILPADNNNKINVSPDKIMDISKVNTHENENK